MTTEPTPLRERVVNWLALLALAARRSGLAARVRGDRDAAAANPGDARAGTLYLCVMPCGQPMQALRQSTHIRAQVTGNVARVSVTQTFENPSDDWVEGLYVFPLSAGAAVDELEMLVGERRIRGEIQRKAGSARHLRAGEERRPPREPRGSGTAEHVHDIGGEHRAPLVDHG